MFFLWRLCSSRMIWQGRNSASSVKQCLQRKLCTLNENNNGEAKIRQTKRLKKLCSSVLFGSTFVAVLYAKRKKREEANRVMEDCVVLPVDNNYAKSLLFYKYRDYVFPDFVIKEKTEIQNFKVREDDIFVVSFPKSGTTWIQEIVYLIGSDLDFQSAKETGLETRFPYLEFIYPGIKDVSKMKSVRYIKSHLPYSLLPPDVFNKKPKIIYVMRNPKDVAVSYYHYVQMLAPTSYKGTFNEFLDSFLQDKVMYGPLWKHNLEYWDHQQDENILIVMYEDLHKDIKHEIRRIARFLGKAVSEEGVEQISKHCSFEMMSANPSVNYKHWDDLGIHNKSTEPFMRKGTVGDWGNYFSQEMNQSFENWQEKNYHKSGLEFVYNLE